MNKAGELVSPKSKLSSIVCNHTGQSDSIPQKSEDVQQPVDPFSGRSYRVNGPSDIVPPPSAAPASGGGATVSAFTHTSTPAPVNPPYMPVKSPHDVFVTPARLSVLQMRLSIHKTSFGYFETKNNH
jgi:hypothetical protein